MKFPDGPAAWTVTVSTSPGQAKNADKDKRKNPAAPVRVRVVKVEVIQDAKKRHTTVFLSNGKTSDTWSIPGSTSVITEDPGGTVFITAQDPQLAPPFGEDSFSWLKPELRASGTVKYEGQPCLYYRGSVPSHDFHGDVLHHTVREAWINAATLLPVALDDGNDLGVFTFSEVTFREAEPSAQAAPKGPLIKDPLQVPDKFARLFRQYERREQGKQTSAK